MKKSIHITIHILVWLLAYLIAFKVAHVPFFYNPVTWITGMVGFYINVYVFVPYYLGRNKSWFQYSCVIVLLFTGLAGLEFFFDYLLKLEPVFLRGRSPNTIAESIILFGAIAFLKTIIVLLLSNFFQFIKDLVIYKKVSTFAEISLHILIIGMLFLLRITDYPQWTPENEPLLFLFKAVYSLLLLTISLSFFYLNVFWFIPRYLSKGKYTLYFSLLLLLIPISMVLEWAIYSVPLFTAQQTAVLTKTIIPSLAFKLLILLASFLYRFSKDWFRHENLRKQLESDKLIAQLDLLKFQVHPHFLFNTLNNIYSQAMQENSPKTVQSVAGLSGLMRYMLEDCKQDLVLLTRELEYIEQYINLQKLRIDRQNKITTDFKIDHSCALLIAPMLLIPFIENAFKHGISTRSPSIIEMKIDLVADELAFSVQNSVHEHKDRPISTGLGLANVRQRLTHLYPDSHTLTVDQRDGIFNVNLKIKLSDGMYSN
ncbi:sensor histidine kinase [Dyadobacter sp. CY356]|uniref:sensor histidine kinase n=1 Tax=Dyadobacter sp. CY356 TaxID=2906442 RepID=UPI001F2C9624|nr:histidine kinase [Dyadobacter sp. CY356]MCF0055369.1 histidine kinase [Dyadobacter sp. CY356]